MRTIDRFMTRQAGSEPSAALLLIPDQSSLHRINNIKRSIELPEGAEIMPDSGTKGPHATIRFWRTDGQGIPDEIRQYLAERLDTQRIRARVKSWELFGKPGEEDTLVLTLESPTLMRIQVEIDQQLQEMGVPPSDYDEYKPHVSIAEHVREKPRKVPKLYLSFDEWTLTESNGDDYDEVWSLRAARWVNRTLLAQAHRFQRWAAVKEPSVALRDLQAILDVADAYVRAQANLADAAGDKRTLDTMRVYRGDIAMARRDLTEAVWGQQFSPDLQWRMAVAFDLARQAIQDPRMDLPGVSLQDISNAVEDYNVIQRQTQYAVSRETSIGRLLRRRTAERGLLQEQPRSSAGAINPPR